MTYDPERITYFGETDFRNKRDPFGIKAKDRTKHVYVIGKTGMGKSTMLENMAVQDIRNGEGFAFIDPHGATAEKLLEYVPPERVKDILYFAPFDMEHPISFNVMEDVGPEKRHLVASGLMSAFKKIWVDAWSARMEYILNNTILALLEYPDSTLISINRMLTDKGYREAVVDNITDSAVKAFWTDEFANYTDRFAAEATPAIQNKVGQFISNPVIRNIIGQPKSSFDVRKMMDERKILIINLSKGRVGEDNANLLGSMLITKIYLSALSRADTSALDLENLPNFYLYVDEFQSFANESFANILSEARKYKLNLTIAHQYIEQMSDEVRAAVFGNVGTMISFRVGAYDAEVLEKEFAPEFTAEDLVNLGFAQIYLKLMINGVSSSPFSATTLPPIPHPRSSYVPQIIDTSRSQFSRPREVIEEEIRIWQTTSFKGTQDRGKPTKEKKNRKSKEDSKIDLSEAISSAVFEKKSSEVPVPNVVHTKGPTKDKLEALKNIVLKKGDETEETDDGFVSLDKLVKKVGDNLPKDFIQAENVPKKPQEILKEDDSERKIDESMDEMDELRQKKDDLGEHVSQKSDRKNESLSGLAGVMSGILGGTPKAPHVVGESLNEASSEDETSMKDSREQKQEEVSSVSEEDRVRKILQGE